MALYAALAPPRIGVPHDLVAQGGRADVHRAGPHDAPPQVADSERPFRPRFLRSLQTARAIRRRCASFVGRGTIDYTNNQITPIVIAMSATLKTPVCSAPASR